VEGGEVSGGPGGPHHAMARPGPGGTTMWCGGMVSPPEVSQVPLCPIFDIKNLKEFSGIFRETLFSRIFQKLTRG
jgi:hypothetical protein